MISCEYNNADGILYVKYVGDITVEELLDYISEIGNNKNYPRVLKVLEDRRDTYFSFSIRENIRISKYALQFAKNYKKVFLAAVNDKPIDTAITIDYQMLMSKFTSKQIIKAFTTFEAAQMWLSNIGKFTKEEESNLAG